MSNTREIKFRAWDGTKNRFVIETDMVHVSIAGDISHCSPSGIDGRNDLTLMQYTGLKDKNGVEIYEGDVLRDDTPGAGNPKEELGQRVGPVVYHDKTAAYFRKVPKGTFLNYPNMEYVSINTEQCEVIGNIYENPELLTN